MGRSHITYLDEGGGGGQMITGKEVWQLIT